MSAVNEKVVLITGGARGSGAEVARRLHAQGRQAGADRCRRGALHDIAAELGGDRVLTVVADVRDLAAMKAAASRGRRTVRRHRRRDGQRGHLHLRLGAQGRPGGVQDADRRQRRRRLPHRARGPAVGDRAPRLRADRVVGGGVRRLSRAGALRRVEGGRSSTSPTRLRLEVAHRGVDVGSAHMLWIDTPLVQEAKVGPAELPQVARRRCRARCGKTTSVESAARRSSRASRAASATSTAPSGSALLRWFKPLLSTRDWRVAAV